ncbi:MAG: hypothetical protein J6S05_05415 [Bacteroidaceae bacterium]|nr:hypothetical protein [Bacteroidaceae bacterium]
MELITDRNEADVARWRTLHDKGWVAMNEGERSEWLSEMKGRYSHTDMNRVESAVQALSSRLTFLGYQHPHLSVKADWKAGDIPTKADFDRYFGNVAVLRSVIAVPGSTPETPTTEKRFDYLLANDLEKILEAIDAGTSKIQKPWIFSGDIFAGEV